MIVIDTDIFIDLFRNQEPAKRLFSSVDFSSILFSVITESEILAGKDCDSQSKKESMIHFLSGFTKMPVNNTIAQTAADFKRKYGLNLDDCLIAATAYHSVAVLYTRNEKDFSKIKEISIKIPY